MKRQPKTLSPEDKAALGEVLGRHNARWSKYQLANTPKKVESSARNSLMRQLKREHDAGKLDAGRGLRSVWQDATFEHLSGYLLLRCFNGESCRSIAVELKALKIQMSERTVQTYLGEVLRRGAEGYNYRWLRPKKRGPSRDLGASLEAELEWLSGRAVQTWHFWPLAELTFYLQCGICPPNRHLVVQGNDKRRKEVAREFTRDWFLRATDHYCEEGRLADDMRSCLEQVDAWLQAIDADADKPKHRLIRKTRKNTALASKGPSRAYVGTLLATLGYVWKQPAFGTPRWTKRAASPRKTKTKTLTSA